MSGRDKRFSGVDLICPTLILAGVCIGGASMLQQHFDDKAAAKVASEIAVDRQRERDASGQRAAHLEQLLDVQRRDSEHDAKERHRHFLAFASTAGRVRDELQARLADSQRSGDACYRGAAAIADAAGAVLELASEGDGLLQEAARENEGLRTENQRLAGQVSGWQQRYALSHPQQIVVTGSLRQGK